MVAASDLGSDVSGRGGSSPFMRTTVRAVTKIIWWQFFYFAVLNCIVC